jgi:hypothetical protein
VPRSRSRNDRTSVSKPLKGADAGVASVLVKAAAEADCDLHLALVSIEESGSAEHTGYYGRRRWSRDDEDSEEFEVAEVIDRALFLSEWRRPDGSEAGFGDFPFAEDELCPPDAFEDLTPDEQHFQEATGNESASFELAYRRAGLVLWPRARCLAVLNQAGLRTTLPHLEHLTARWETSSASIQSPLWREADELSGHMLRSWSRSSWRGQTTTPKPAGCSICRSGWGTGSASMRFSPNCPPKAIMPRPTTGRSCAPPPFFRPRAQRSCWFGLSGVTLRPISAPAAICCCVASWRRCRSYAAAPDAALQPKRKSCDRGLIPDTLGVAGAFGEEARAPGGHASELVVVQPLNADWICHRCGGTGDLLMMETPGSACLRCVGLDDLEYLPAGDALLIVGYIRDQNTSRKLL